MEFHKNPSGSGTVPCRQTDMRLLVAFSNNFTSAPKKTGFIVPASLNWPQHPHTLQSNGHAPCFPAIILIMRVDLQPNNNTGTGTSKRAAQL